MRLSLILISIILGIIGIIFTVTVVGALIGVPIIIIAVILFILGLILPIRA